MSSLLESQVYWRLIALAQLVPELDQEVLFDWVSQALNGPLNSVQLDKLTLAQLQERQPQGVVLDEGRWQTFLAILHGQLPVHLDPVPAPSLEGALQVAFTSTDGININGHFGSCPLFFIYQVTATKSQLIDIRRYAEGGKGAEVNEEKSLLLAGCQLLFCESIGGPAAARVIRHGLHPVKVKKDPVIALQVRELQQVMAGVLPPWLAKVVGRKDDLSRRFDLQSELDD